MSGQPPP